MFGFDFGAPVSVSSVTVGGRADLGVRTFTIEVSHDGRSWRTVATVLDHPIAGGTISFAREKVRYLRLRITDTWDPIRPTRNVQISEVTVAA